MTHSSALKSCGRIGAMLACLLAGCQLPAPAPVLITVEPASPPPASTPPASPQPSSASAASPAAEAPASETTAAPSGANAAPAPITQGAAAEQPLYQRDPLGFLRELRARCGELDEYEVEFFRQERTGLLAKSLKPEEHMRVKFRAEPLSVLMQILNPDHDFTRVVFVEGRNEGKMRCFWRKSLLPGFAPPVNDYAPSMAVTFGRSSSPITSFGVQRMMERIVGAIDQATDMGHPPQVHYVGRAAYEKGGPPVHHIQVNYGPQSGFERRRIDVLVHADSLLPAGCYCWLENGELDAKYLYADYDLGVDLKDTDFSFENPGKTKGKSAAAPPRLLNTPPGASGVPVRPAAGG